MPVPAIYTLHRPLPLLSVGPRLVAGAIALICLAVLIVATHLHADPSGMETHLQLGLAPCAMLRSSGVPCPMCGMTTSFTQLVHGHLLKSLATQPAGTLFCLLTAAGVWAGAYVAATGRPSARLINRLPVTTVFLALLAIALAGWAYKIVLVLRA